MKRQGKQKGFLLFPRPITKHWISGGREMNFLVWKNIYLAQQQATSVTQRASGGLGRSWHWVHTVDAARCAAQGGSYDDHTFLWKLREPDPGEGTPTDRLHAGRVRLPLLAPRGQCW